MARNAGCGFDLQDEFGGDLLSAIYPFPDGRLGTTDQTPEGGLPPDGLNGPVKSLHR